MTLTGKQKGILLMMASALSFACMQIVVRLTRNIPTMEQIFVRNLFILWVSFFYLRKNKKSLFGEKKYQPWLFARSFFGFLGLITLFYASSNASQGDVTILNKMSPMLVTLFAVIFLKEKLQKIQIPALVLAFVGAAVVIQPIFTSNALPIFAALLSAVSSGIAYTLLGYFKDKVDGMTVIMHFSTFSALASIPFMLANFVMPTFKEFCLLLLIGVFGSFGQFAITYAYRCGPASEISIYNYSGILFSMVLGYVVLGEPMKSTSLLGGFLVILASVMVYLYGGKNQDKAKAKPSK
ncbi:MAG: DMT family transporter [Oscillospiraceae bacterium]